MRNRWFLHGVLVCAVTALSLGCSGDDAKTPDGKVGSDGIKGDHKIIQADGQNCAQPKQYWPDADNDGYGSALADAVSACSPPAGYIDNPADCADGDPDAHPGQTAFFDREIKGDTTNKWDFNCDGQVENEVTAAAVVCNGRGYTVCEDAVPAGTWWGTKAPACGETGKVLTSCVWNGQKLADQCTANTGADRTQRCR